MSRKPDHHDAELILKLYDLRRESVMRASRETINGQFWPKTYEEFEVATRWGNPLNAAFRQTMSYWEMAYGMARHGIVDADYLAENCGEGLFLYTKCLPYIAKFRESAPYAFQNAEWIATQTERGRQIFAHMSAMIQKMAAEPKK